MTSSKKPRKPRDMAWSNWSTMNVSDEGLWCSVSQYLTIKEAKTLSDWLTRAVAYLEAKEGK